LPAGVGPGLDHGRDSHADLSHQRICHVSQATEAPKTGLQRLLDVVERVGNKVPHPAVPFLVLIGLVVLLSHVLHLLGVSVSYERLNPQTHAAERITTGIESMTPNRG
jgi:aminobenzoyl-glutamate transport protein